MDLKTVLAHQDNLALIIGNGINRYGGDQNSWGDLLGKIAQKHKIKEKIGVEGLTLTEFYDLLQLDSPDSNLQVEFCKQINNWTPKNHHKRIVEWAHKNQKPILTTNFERTLADCGPYLRRRTVKEKFTDYYPWDTYFGPDELKNPSNQFGIWHINGTQEYPRSIRLGLDHYMGSVQRARTWLHKDGSQRLFSGNSHNTWHGSKTWLQIIFDSDLLFFGLGLDENEVFLRWLLIQRARYFVKFPQKKRLAWYVDVKSKKNISEGKKAFLEGIGISIITVAKHDEIYEESAWK